MTAPLSHDQAVSEVHRFASLAKAKLSGDQEALRLWTDTYGDFVLDATNPDGIMQQIERLVSNRIEAGVVFSVYLAHKVAALQGITVMEAIDQAEAEVAELMP